MDDMQRYHAALHAMQTGVAAKMALGETKDTEPKHLRVGVNAAMCDSAALVKLLVAKGLFTMEDYHKAIADQMEEEVARYTKLLREKTGKNIELH